MPLTFLRPAAVFCVLVLGFLGGLSLAAGAHAAPATVHTVTTLADDGPGSLRQALLAANSAAGPETITFAVTGTIALASPLPLIVDDLTLQGPGAGSLAISGAGLYRVLDISPTLTNTVAVTVADLSLVDGRAPDGEHGGAIRSHGDLQLLRSSLHDNSSPLSGSAIYAAAGSLAIVSSQVQTNSAGSLFVEDAHTSITGTVLAGNQGGALVAFHAPTLHITATQITSNTGRGIEAGYSDLDLADLQVNANGDSGIASFLGTISLRDSVLIGNHSDEGGGIYSLWGAVIVTDTLLQGNIADSGGGGVYVAGGSTGLTMTRTILDANQAPYGGGIYLGGGALAVQSSHILANAGGHGPGLYFDSPQDGAVIDSCIANNWVTVAGGAAVELPPALTVTTIGTLSAPNNWWGAAGGPGGAGQGSGDSVDARVLVANFKTSPPAGCPLRSVSAQYLPSLRK